MWHIIENFDDSCDYSCYFNANAIVNKHSKDIFDLKKISASYHSYNSKNNPYSKNVKKDYYLAAYKEEVDLKRFIFLRDKNDYFN